MYKLTETEIKYLSPKITACQELEKSFKFAQLEVNSLLALICLQNNLDGNYKLNTEDWTVTKVEDNAPESTK